MIRNYLKIAYRNLLRQKLYSAINISGLAIGLCVCMLIMLYVAHELSFDRFHTNAKRIYGLDEHAKMGGNTMQFANTNFVTGPVTRQSDPGVEGFMRIHNPDNPVIIENPSRPNTRFLEPKVLFTDVDFFSFFSFKLLQGSALQVLTKAQSVVITANTARKYFGNQNPVGKTLKIGYYSAPFVVTGVAEDAPSNSSIKFDFVLAHATLNVGGNQPMFNAQFIGSGSFKTYLLLKNGADTGRVKRTMRKLLQMDKGMPDAWMMLTAMPDMHFKSNYGDFANIKYLKIFPLVAALILLLALVNYMSLATSRATLRAKEVGVRKVNGASRQSIALQFYIESALFAIVSFVLAYILCYTFKDPFLNILQLKMDTAFLHSPLMLSIMLGLLLLTIIIAGSYPAVVLSKYNPVITLKGQTGKQAGGVVLRKIFTTLQFAIAVGLIICGITIDRQLYYFRHKDTGVNRDNVVMVPISNTFGSQYQSFKKDIQLLAGVSQVATAHYPMYRSFDAIFTNGGPKNESVVLFMFSVDQNFIPELDIRWKVPPVSSTALTQAKQIVINETALARLKITGNPIGKIIDANDKFEIAGVVKDFNSGSMEREISPNGFFISADTASKWGKDGGCMYAKIKPHTNMQAMISAIKDRYKKYDAVTPFEYTFLDDAYNQQYKAEERLSAIFSTLTIITIVLAALGLFGLAAFTIEQRTREIGIRKVLGASLSSIAQILSFDFLKLVILAFVLASPVAWWAMHSWLQNFVYRITIPWWVFAAAGMLAVMVAVLTISYHALRAAIVNPVKSLRSE